MSESSPDRRVSKKLRQIADDLNAVLEDVAGQPMGFSLLVFHAAPGSRMNYISNCDREEVRAALKSLVAGWEAGMPDIPAHEFDGGSA